MKQTTRLYTLFIAFFLLFPPLQTIKAQVYEILEYRDNESTAIDQIIDLQSGTLVVKLVSKQKSISAIEAILARDQITPKSRQKLTRKVNDMIDDRERANKEILAALFFHYDFSDYRVIYDTATSQISNGKTSGYFLNKNLEVDPNISIDLEKPVYLLRYGQGNSSETNNFEGLILTNRQHQDLKKPFPYFVKSKYPFLSSFSAFIGKTETIYPDFTKMIKRLNIKLTRFHKRKLLDIEQKKLKKQIKDLKEGKE